jgi:hypothetical protein
MLGEQVADAAATLGLKELLKKTVDKIDGPAAVATSVPPWNVMLSGMKTE